MLRLVLLLLLLTACESTDVSQPYSWQLIAGRNEDRQDIYRTVVPEEWRRLDSATDLADTMQPIVEYWIDDQVRIVVHNFPSNNLSERIPPEAQVSRWMRQAGGGTVTTECHGGFYGLRLEHEGVIAWAMQLDPELYLAITGPPTVDNDRQRRADYTIKATGPQEALERYRTQIETFAQKFELIEPILSY